MVPAKSTAGTRREVPGAVLGTYFLKQFNRYPSTNKQSLYPVLGLRVVGFQVPSDSSRFNSRPSQLVITNLARKSTDSTISISSFRHTMLTLYYSFI
ncbi:hypothetical protein PGTUg99_035478 [Puccinia graminis f. sp. tritici]|uniref:Uncharacterized protein n=1 Tax=Puccinia graminis f. sp. tritici TaxID=56615 RepID=A0A5B0SPI3_PUCGR|nr:hypothetical protein PGTUg99_035478 [Puccinia graminis f. sp. tritici]